MRTYVEEKRKKECRGFKCRVFYRQDIEKKCLGKISILTAIRYNGSSHFFEVYQTFQKKNIRIQKEKLKQFIEVIFFLEGMF